MWKNSRFKKVDLQRKDLHEVLNSKCAKILISRKMGALPTKGVQAFVGNAKRGVPQSLHS